eukprot:gene7142-11455_t
MKVTVLITLFFALFALTQAKEFHFKGGISGSLLLLTNWLIKDGGGNFIAATALPTSADSIYFDQDGTSTINFDTTILTFAKVTVGGGTGVKTLTMAKKFTTGVQGLVIAGNGVLKLSSGGSIEGSGNIAIAQNGKLSLEGGTIKTTGASTFQVNGTLEVGANVNSTTETAVAIASSGTMKVVSGANFLLNAGATITAEASSSVTLEGSIYASSSSSSLSVSGSLTANAGASATATLGCALTATGQVIVSSGTFVCESLATISGTATLAVSTNAEMKFKGNVAYSSSGSASGNGKIVSEATFETSSTASKTVSILLTFENKGTFKASGSGKTVITSSYKQNNNGTYFTTNSHIEVQGNAALRINNGTINGNGNITTSVLTSGSVFNAGNSPGNVFVNGDLYVDTDSVLVMEIEGTSNGQYDRVFASGKITVRGFIDFRAQGSYSATLGNKFKVLTYTSVDMRPVFVYITGNGFFNRKPMLTVGSSTTEMEIGAYIGAGNSVRPSLLLVVASTLLLALAQFL